MNRFDRTGEMPTYNIGSITILFAVILFVCSCANKSDPKLSRSSSGWYSFDKTAVTRWSSPENLNGKKGAGGMDNGTAKGHAYVGINAGATAELLNIQGGGIINRIWITVIDRSPQMLRSLVIEMYWDDQTKPAVSVPLGDFFGVGLGRTAAFFNAAFANPEGRSFNCFIPMPFRTGAKILVRNESSSPLTHLYFDIDYQLGTEWNEDNLYFHAFWSRDTATTPGRDFELLPQVSGYGRFLGMNMGVNANPLYGESWWGEGEMKFYMDGDKEFPTLAGTGSEDYIGTGWGQGAFSNPYAGCLIADSKNRQWTLYRFHLPDPIYFDSSIRVTMQQIGGDAKAKVLAMQKAKVPIIPVTIDHGESVSLLIKDKKSLDDPSLADGWTNFYRSDDVSATAYFYLSKPASSLPSLQAVSIRTNNMKAP
jgi:Protein of unknown function (DUF2961)